VRDEIILACELVRQNDWRALDGHDPRVIDLSELLNRNPLHPLDQRDAKFRNPNGVGRKTADIATRHPDYQGRPTKGNRLDRVVLADFLADPLAMSQAAAEIRAAVERGDVDASSVALADVDDFDDEAYEGRILLARHLRRERNPKLRRRKIESVRAAGRPIACEVCEFDFERAYGKLGRGFIEVHHKLPLHVSGEIRTRLSDLALLCSNCHRMIHRGRPWLAPAELRTTYDEERSNGVTRSPIGTRS
jgi:5-methylcytosine-specific restriction protein A